MRYKAKSKTEKGNLKIMVETQLLESLQRYCLRIYKVFFDNHWALLNKFIQHFGRFLRSAW